jgi:excinuclease UvrABC nuclease subunit
LVKYGSEALDMVEHLGLVLNNQSTALSLLEHFGSVANLTRASVQDLLQFVSPAQAAQLVLSMIHNHKVRKVCYWHVMAELRRLSI